MIHLYPADSRYRANHGWLQSQFSFSFAEYYDPLNMGFGPLRVLNDDIVAPGTGFGMHPHRNMEIITFVLNGQLEHRDGLGNIEIMRPGIIQKMSAGRGIRHSEMNPSTSEPVELLQLWIEPSALQLDPGYEMVSYEVEQLCNQLHPVVSHLHQHGQGHIHQDTTLFLSDLDADQEIEYKLGPDRRAFLFVIDGTLQMNHEHLLNRRDSARVFEEPLLTIKALHRSKILFIDLP
jgi:redox-sensitive bicupin YhaK (pirin superfamily)